MVGGSMGSDLSLLQVFIESTVVPVKSSFSEYRKTISYQFFQEIFQEQVTQINSLRPTWKGLNVFAIDGDQYALSATADVLNDGYTGSPVSEGRETYYPKMYVSLLYDILSGTCVNFAFSSIQDELDRAYQLISSCSSQTLILYDRLYFNVKLVSLHSSCQSFFICRLKGGPKALKIVQEFISNDCSYKCVTIEGCEVHLIKYENPQTGELSYFATNLPRHKFTEDEIALLYTRRWDIETTFRDLSCTMGLESTLR